MKNLKKNKNLKKTNFICIGACHKDNILKIKTDYKLYRTNPVIFESRLGGVCSNIANYMAFFTNFVQNQRKKYSE